MYIIMSRAWQNPKCDEKPKIACNISIVVLKCEAFYFGSVIFFGSYQFRKL